MHSSLWGVPYPRTPFLTWECAWWHARRLKVFTVFSPSACPWGLFVENIVHFRRLRPIFLMFSLIPIWTWIKFIKYFLSFVICTELTAMLSQLNWWSFLMAGQRQCFSKFVMRDSTGEKIVIQKHRSMNVWCFPCAYEQCKHDDFQFHFISCFFFKMTCWKFKNEFDVLFVDVIFNSEKWWK